MNYILFELLLSHFESFASTTENGTGLFLLYLNIKTPFNR